MSRTIKKLLYGLFYLFLLFLLFWIFFGPSIKPEPSCSDGVQNQGENGIDCGGPCTSCEVLHLAPLKSLGLVKIFARESGQAVLLGEVLNSNENYKAKRFSYRFLIYDPTNHLIEEIQGSDSAFALERKYIFEGRISSRFDRMGKVGIEFFDVTWEKAHGSLKPSLTFSGATKTVTDKIRIEVSGRVKNQSSFLATDIKIVAILFDKYEIELLASQWVISSLDGFEEKQFTVIFPADPEVLNNIDTTLTKVFLSSR